MVAVFGAKMRKDQSEVALKILIFQKFLLSIA